MSFTGQFNFGYPITSQNIITNVPDNAVLPLSIGNSLQGNILGVTFADLKSQIAPTFTNCNIAFGEDALSSITTGEYNVGIGCNVLKFNTNGSNNVAIGASTLQNSTTGENNTAIGYQALYNNTTGVYNTFIGISAGRSITTGSGNVGLGWSTLSGGPDGTGQNNIGIGQLAGANVGAANFSIAIGSGTQINGHSCSIVLGQNASATASNQLVIGSQFAGENIGTIATESLTPNRTWTVRINGANYKIPLLAI